MNESPSANESLSAEDRKLLQALFAHPGWNIYRHFLEELRGLTLTEFLNAPNWEQFIVNRKLLLFIDYLRSFEERITKNEDAAV